MADIIQLLPDHLANQIAAGEVIQRPASAVKELLENAIDAGATEIQLIIKDAGKELIQVVDNGKGMSPMDARMSFERHATSKIRQIDDLFAIRTMGFRGEALASIAAVAQVSLKTRQASDDVGIHLEIASSEVVKQEPVAVPVGTNMAIRNLFYNVPARRKFLKSNTSEFKHIIDEFTRVSMAYPHIAFRLFNNNVEQFHLNSGNLKTRIVELLGNKYEKNLVPVAEETELLKISGFIGKPESATKTRGNQYFFINNRFIRNAYLHHAVTAAFESLIEKDAFPFYVLFLELDPQRVDVNVHPTKQEVKFDDDRIMYAYLHAAIKHALGKFNIAPSLDFSLNSTIQNLEAVKLPQSTAQKEATMSGYISHSFSQPGNAHFIQKNNDRAAWAQQQKHLMSNLPLPPDSKTLPQIPHTRSNTESKAPEHTNEILADTAIQEQTIIQWRDFIIATMKSGLLVMNQKKALERIRYDKIVAASGNYHLPSQQSLFPSTIQLGYADATLLKELIPLLQEIGFDINDFGNNSFVIQGTPPDLPSGTEETLIEELLEQAKHEANLNIVQYRDKILRLYVKRTTQLMSLNKEAAKTLIDELFASAQPQYTPDGNRIFQILPKEALDNLLK